MSWKKAPNVLWMQAVFGWCNAINAPNFGRTNSRLPAYPSDFILLVRHMNVIEPTNV
jgi:hypothetical protein